MAALQWNDAEIMALRRFAWAGLTQKEAAAQLGTSTGAVRRKAKRLEIRFTGVGRPPPRAK